MAKPHGITDKANVMPEVHSLPVDQKPSHRANLRGSSEDGKSFAGQVGMGPIAAT
jgi:hypothetical protein